MYISITILLALLTIGMLLLIFLPDNREALSSSKDVNNTPPTPCQVNFVDYCRHGWKIQTNKSNQFSAGGVQWSTFPDACASKFNIEIINNNGSVTETPTFDKNNITIKPTGINGGPQSIYSYAIQGRTHLDKLGGASAFTAAPCDWIITPIPDDPTIPVSSIKFTMDTDSAKECGDGSYYYCPLGPCNH